MEETTNYQKQKKDIQNKAYRFNSYILELYSWAILGLLISFLFWGFNLNNNDKSIILNRIVLLFVFIIAPCIFKLIFAKFPFEYIRDKFYNKDTIPDIILRAILESEYNLDTQKLLAHNIHESKTNAERLFSQSRVYLFLGCMIAIAGVVIFFYAARHSIVDALLQEILRNNDSVSVFGIKILEYLPRFGVLFFIEYIAFFFLKQYRILMEEYRYYEAIKRERQDILSVYLLIKEYNDKPEIQKTIIDYIDKHSAKVPYITGAHKIKTEKLVYDDLDLLSKVTSLVQAVKSNGKATD